METIGDVIDKKGSIEHIWRLIDPDTLEEARVWNMTDLVPLNF